MSVTSSPRQDITEFLGRRRLAVIPKDQQKLLERKDSWAVDLKNAPHGLANVPGHVLERAIQAYKARKNSRPSRSSSPNGSEGSNHENINAEPSSPPPEALPSSSPEKLVSWPPSPERAQLRQEAPVESPVVREMPNPASIAPPPLPKPQLQQAPAFDDDLQNSDEEDLEIELPQAQAQLDVPVNMAAAGPASTATLTETDSVRAVETPPCAQPSPRVVPDTVVKQAIPLSKPAAECRRRRHKLIELTSSPIRATIPTAASKRMPTTNVYLYDISSSHSTSPSPMVPATIQDSSLGSVIASIEHSMDPVVTAQVVTTEQETGQTDVHMEDDVVETTLQSNHTPWPEAVVDQPAPEPRLQSAPAPVVEQLAPSPLVKQPAPARGSEVPNRQLNPYEAFAAMYPDYVTAHGGSLWNFVKACICVEFLQKERSLRECLYDDFIRAFSGGYLRYVAKAGPGQEPLPAIEWFNSLAGAALYNRMIVTRRDLEYIFRCFPNEVERARHIIRDDTPDAAREEKRAEVKPKQTPKPTLRRREPPPCLGVDGAMDVGPPEAAAVRPPSRPQTPPSLHPRGPLTQLPLPPSPQPRFESSVAAATPTALASSRYLERPVSRAKSSGAPRKRSAEEKARLREHFRKRQASRGVSSSCSKAR
ncbi:hypothetical protein TOPH_04297 [Tolypocladium ophioglossoides CBS 100239]|uniref:Uncharacterized protein n=1 Tax=Tolypocladium ophioglossoides (strain CBS 100239) TaxID=1163406 RepID=A0A0L0NA65_TOLOC|nr:hypothetical protein TOPH_04297 [Tolypocladium ophioglossoides CBS 100239]